MTDTELEPLPWFAFNIAHYVTDTMRLTTEGHGAYLLLMLDYYATGVPCPDDDFILAALAKLPEERWKQVRKVLEPLFDVREGRWFHRRIEREMREAMLRHSASITHAKAGAAARWEKERSKPAPSAAKGSQDTARRPKRAPSNARALPAASPEQSPGNAHLTLNTPLITEGGEAPPEGDDLGIGGPVPKDFLPNPETSDRARAAGMSVEDIDSEVRKFIGRRLGDGALSHDWQGSFAEWIEREIGFRKKAAVKAPPRVEVSNRYVPTEAELDRALALFANNASSWSRQLGPEPGQAGCKIAPALIEKHGIDPKTGLRVRKAS
jgi:uncharacterized protein YdaU (DUF1376 family)